MCDRKMTWDELCAEMVKQRKRAEKAEAERDECERQFQREVREVGMEMTRAEKAEAERDGYKHQIEAADSILETYGTSGPLLHDRVFKVTGRLEAKGEELEAEQKKLVEVLRWYAEKAHAITRCWKAKPPKIDAAIAAIMELSFDGGQRADQLLEKKS